MWHGSRPIAAKTWQATNNRRLLVTCASWRQWEEEKRAWEEHSRRFDAGWSERQRLGVTDSAPFGEGSNAVWSRSFSIGDTADVPLGTRVFGFGCRLAELIVGLRAGCD